MALSRWLFPPPPPAAFELAATTLDEIFQAPPWSQNDVSNYFHVARCLESLYQDLKRYGDAAKWVVSTRGDTTAPEAGLQGLLERIRVFSHGNFILMVRDEEESCLGLDVAFCSGKINQEEYRTRRAASLGGNIDEAQKRVELGEAEKAYPMLDMLARSANACYGLVRTIHSFESSLDTFWRAAE